MIYPTRFAVLLVAFGAPLAAGLGAGRGGLGSLGLVWIGAAGALLLLDAVMCASGRRLAVRITTPAGLFIGRSGEVRIDAGFAGRALPRSIDIAVAGNEKLRLEPDRGRARIENG